MTKPTGRPRGRPKTKEYSTLMARVPEELVERVKRYAARKQQPISVVIRDALEILLEEDRYQPFMSDRKAGDENLSDIKVDRLHMMSDMNEGDDITSDTNRDEEAPSEPQPVIMPDTKAGDDIRSDRKEALPDNMSDVKEAGYILSDIKTEGESQSERHESALVSDTHLAFDPVKYRLGRLCKRGHAWGTTGKTLYRNTKAGYCIECNNAFGRQGRQKKRQANAAAHA